MAGKLSSQLRQWSVLSRLLALTLGIFVAIALAGYFRSTASHARADMQLMLDGISNESTAVTSEYLAGPEAAAHVVAGMTTMTGKDLELEQSLFANLIAATSHIDAVFVGFPDGAFRFVARADTADADFRTRTITGPDRRMTESFTTADMNPIRSAEVPDHGYDPRERSWYLPIAQGAEKSWSDPYVFASSGKLGVTYSVAVRDSRGDLAAVVGVDLTLDNLVAFLKDRRPSENGFAQVVNDSGAVLVGSETDVLTMLQNPSASLVQLSHAASVIAELKRAAGGDQVPTAGQFRRGDSWGTVSAVSPNSSWYLLVQAPQSDFNAQPQRLISNATVTIIFWALLSCLFAYVLLYAAGRRVLHLSNMAVIDELTLIPNRSGIFRHLGALLSNADGSDNITVAILDLDRFKAVNDSFGHVVGDETLREVAKRLAAIAESHGMHCGRLGGDEFVVFGFYNDRVSASPIWQDILESIAGLSSVGDCPIDLNASIGVVAMPHAMPIEVAAALQLADRALYAAKHSGGNRTRFSTHQSALPDEPSLATTIIESARELVSR